MTEGIQKPKLQIDWARLAGGAATTVIALGGGGFDMFNNATFGWEKSLPIAGTFALAAVGLMALPAMAHKLGQVRTWLLVGVCGALSLYAGYKNHMASQRNHDLTQAAVTTRYDQAQKAIAAAQADMIVAKAEAEGIKEALGSAELQKLYDEAKARRDMEMSADRGAKCGANCRAAEKVMDGALPRIAEAKAREAAMARASDALARMEREKAASPAAPKQHGESAEEEAIMAVLLLLLTIGGATFFECGVKEIREAVSWSQPKKAKVVAVAAKIEASPVASGMSGFIGLCRHGEPVPIKDAHAALVAWWKKTGQAGRCPSAKALSSALGKSGFEKRLDRHKRSSFAVKVPEVGLRIVAGIDKK